MSWTEPRGAGHALRFSAWDGDGWSEPRTIAEGADWFVNWADFPSLAVLEDGTLAAHWLVKSGADRYSYDVVLAFSRDGGATWTEPFRPHRDGTPTEHGFVSLVPGAGGRLEVLWLDGRSTAPPQSGAMTLRHATVFPDGRVASETEVDGRVCDCCSTDAVRLDDGALLVVYRDRSAEEIRDISFSRIDGSSRSEPRPLAEDGWKIEGCPVNGPALAIGNGTVAAAWFTAARDVPAVWVAFSRDGGRSFGEPVRIDRGNPLGRVDLVGLDDGGAVVSWLEREEGGARLLLRRVTPAGAGAAIPLAETSDSRSSGFPRLARAGDRVLVAWTAPGDPSRIATASWAPAGDQPNR